MDDIFDRIKGMEIMLKNPDYAFAAFTAYYQFQIHNIQSDTLDLIMDGFNEPVRKSVYYEHLRSLYITIKKVAISQPAPNFSVPDTAGNIVELDDFKGKYVLLEFWASGCGGCRMENPNLLKNYTEYKQSGFEILSISMDKNKDHWAEAVKKDSMIWTTASNLDGMDGDLAMIYDVNYVPKIYLLDTSGVIIAQDIRGEELGVKLNEIFQQ